MAVATRIGEAQMLDHAHTSAVAAGEILAVGNLVLVASRKAVANELIGYHTEGLFGFPKPAGVLNKGVPIYWDPVTNGGQVTGTAGALMKIGHAAAASLTGDTVQPVRFQQLG